MSLIGYSREAVRVKVKKCEPNLPPEYRKFSVDPQITTLEVLYSILAKAFDVKYDFTISYKALDPAGAEIFLVVLSDFDLDAAFLRTHNHSLVTGTDPCLTLRIDIKPFTEVSSSQFESTATTPGSTHAQPVLLDRPVQQQQQTPSSASALAQSFSLSQRYVQSRLPGLIMNHVEKTFNIVQKALNITDDEQQFLSPPRPPLTDSEFRGFLDSVGRIMNADQLRRVIYIGGIEPSLRRVVWKHILNVYPDGMTGKERMDYMKKKAAEYYNLRDVWRVAIQNGCSSSELAYVTGMVRKDVLRTDRLHPFYAGHDDNQNIASLFNVLTTYALNHPAVSYCQGMSDIASPLLVTMNDEAHAYICFCAAMKRLYANFMIDGLAMTTKFAHLTEALQYYDPEFFEYLRQQQADDLLFCYRWLLLEMKREFAFSDSLRMLEVLWSSLPADPPQQELLLAERPFVPTSGVADDLALHEAGKAGGIVGGGVGGGGGAIDDRLPRETVYTKVCALRRQNSALSLCSSASPSTAKTSPSPGGLQNRFNQSLDETRLTRSQSRERETLSPPPKSNETVEEQQFVFPTDDTPASPSSASSGQQQRPGVAKRLASTNPFLSPGNLSPGGHFKDLKERLSKPSGPSEDGVEREEDTTTSPPPRVVKSFNEFLNLAAAAGTKIKWKRTQSQDDQEGPVAQEREESKKKRLGAEEEEEDGECLSKGTTTNSNESSPDDAQEYFPMTTSVTRELRLELENLDRQVFGVELQERQRRREEEKLDCDTPESGDSARRPRPLSPNVEGYRQLGHLSTDTYEGEEEEEEGEDEEMSGGGTNNPDPDEITKCPDHLHPSDRDLGKRLSSCSINNDVFVWENPLHNITASPSTASMAPQQQPGVEIPPPPSDFAALPPEQGLSMFVDPIELSQQMETSCEEAAEAAAATAMSIRKPGALPPPADFGGGNPFLMFLCLTLLLQHRDFVMRSGLDYNEMAMHFDKMVRKHNVTRTLNQARHMYADYLASFKGRSGERAGNVANVV